MEMSSIWQELFKVWKPEPVLSEHAGTREDRCQKVMKDAEQLMTHAKMMRTKRWQHRRFMW